MLFLIALALAVPHHEVEVELSPESGRLAVVDRITGIGDSVELKLHHGLAPSVATRGWRLEWLRTEEQQVRVDTWRLYTTRKRPRWPVDLRYGGPIEHPIQTAGEEYQRSFSETPGTIGEEGVYLAPSTVWLPDFGEPSTYRIAPKLPEGWSAVVSGNPSAAGWESPAPTEEAVLVAGRWTHTATEVQTAAGGTGVDIYLREADPGLAYRYTAATERTLHLYESMLTPYPFERFALVENFWDTGYGMPGFTLLGPQVIRFPWVLTSSYPHEILHTWWGNSATVTVDGGNWSEGLTAYMADHLFAEHRGQDALYRRSTLKKFTDIAGDHDFPLVDFRGRTSAATEAVGYGKSLMFWHMIRRHIGEEAFLEGLSAFHRAFAFKAAGFSDIEPFLSESSGEDLSDFFEAWTTEIGAVELGVSDVAVTETETGWMVRGMLSQPESSKPAWVPVRVTTQEGTEAIEVAVSLTGTQTPLELEVPAAAGRPLRLDIDPDFDVMRILDPLEVPPALTTVFGEEEAVFVLPSTAGEDEREAWTQLASGWARPGEPKLIEDSEVDAPPPGSWVLGWENLHGQGVAEGVAETGARVDEEGLSWDGESFDRSYSTVLIARSEDPERAVGWVTAGDVEAIAGLARKLPHYTKYGLLAFSGTAPDNVAKAVWPATRSPLSIGLVEGPLAEARPGPPRAPLAEMPPRFDSDVLLAEATWFAAPERMGRGLGSAGLREATDRVLSELESIGVAVERQVWTESVAGAEVELSNVVATVPGSGRGLAPVVVLAHLDHLGMGEGGARSGNEGKLHPGADDNASGVAVALALLRTLAAEPARSRPVVFVFTTAEESGLLGARHWLTGADAPFACLALDTVGRLADSGKITVLGAETARELRFLFMGVGYTTGAVFAFAQPGVVGSDHGVCLEAGVPGVQLTTGATADYHAPTDTAETLDGPGLATVAEAAIEAVAYLAERTDPLTVQIGEAAPPATEGRRASLGTMPDFEFAGPGVRVSAVMPDSAALEAQIRPGDVLLAVDHNEIVDLRGFSKLLKSKSPGDTVQIRLLREGAEQVVEAKLRAR